MTQSKKILERFVTEVTLAYLERERGRPEPASEVVDAGEAREVDVLRQRLEALAVDYAQGVVTQQQLHAATRSRSPSVVEAVPYLREAWNVFDLETRRAVVGRSGVSNCCPSPQAGPASTRTAWS